MDTNKSGILNRMTSWNGYLATLYVNCVLTAYRFGTDSSDFELHASELWVEDTDTYYNCIEYIQDIEQGVCA